MTSAEYRHDARNQEAPQASTSRTAPDAASAEWTVLSLLRTGTRRCRIAAALVAVVVGMVSQTVNQAFAQARETVLYLDDPAVSNERASRAGKIAGAYSEPGLPASPETLAWLEVPLRPAHVSPPTGEARKAFASVTAPDGEGVGGVTADAALEAGGVMLAQLDASPPGGEEDESRDAELAAAGAVRPELGDGTQAPEEGQEEEAYVAEPARQPEAEPGADVYGGAGDEPYGAGTPDYASATPEGEPSGGAGLIVPAPPSDESDPGQDSSDEIASVLADDSAGIGIDYRTGDEPYGPAGPISDTGQASTEQPVPEADEDIDEEPSYPEQGAPTAGESELAETVAPPASPPARPTVDQTGADTGPIMEQEGETVLVPFSPPEGEEQTTTVPSEPAEVPAPAPTTLAEDGGSDQSADGELPSPAEGTPDEGSGGGPSEHQPEVSPEQGRTEDQEDGEDEAPSAEMPSGEPPTEAPPAQVPAEERPAEESSAQEPLEEPAVEEQPARQTEEDGPPEVKVGAPEETPQPDRGASDEPDPGDGSDSHNDSDNGGGTGQDDSRGTPEQPESPSAEASPRGEQTPNRDSSVQEEPAPSQDSGTRNDASRPEDSQTDPPRTHGGQNDIREEPDAEPTRDQRQGASHDRESREPRNEHRGQRADSAAHIESVEEPDGGTEEAQGNAPQSSGAATAPTAERRAERRAQREATGEQSITEPVHKERTTAQRAEGGQATIEQATYQQQLAMNQAAQAQTERRAAPLAQTAVVRQADIEEQYGSEQSAQVQTHVQPAPEETRHWAPTASQQTDTVYQEQEAPNQTLAPAPQVQQPLGQAAPADVAPVQSVEQANQGADVQATPATGSIKLPGVGR